MTSAQEEKAILAQKLNQPPAVPSQTDYAAEALVTDGYMVQDLVPPDEEPPAYGDLHDQMQFSQPGVEAGAVVNDVGRVSISINTKNRLLADLLAPTFRAQERAYSSPALPPAYIPPSLGGQPGQPRPPRMNVVVQIVGSRGDVQPFVALGKVLKNTYGHRVRIATHPNFQSFVEENGLEFFSIGGDPAELMAFMVKHPGLMPGFGAIKSGEVTKRRKGIAEMLLGCWRSCFEAGDGLGPAQPPHRDEPLDFSQGLPYDDGRDHFVADAIIANPPSFAHVHIAEKLGIPLHMMFTMPWSPTRAFPHPLADIKSSNADEVLTQYLSYALVEMMTWQGLGDVINRFREKALDLPPLSMIWAPGLLNRLKIPYTYCWSPSLIPKPNDWGKHIDISGFYFLDLATNFTPDPDLAAFLAAGPPPVYIGFGSIVVDDPNALTQMIFEAIRTTGVRALVSKGWGGLGADDVGIPEGVYMLGNVPHDWLFQHVSCVVHHGGAGTTAAGIKAGKPTLVVPFFGDQPFWGSMVARAGAGPDPIPYKQLTAQKLADSISFCIQPDTIEKAMQYGEKVRNEKGTDVGAQAFHNHLDVESLRCSLAPSHTAVWRLRRSKVRLSPLAAATLVEQGALQYTDLKLYRAKEHNTDDQPPDPISAAACSLVADASGIGMAIADMPRELFRTRRKESDVFDTPERRASPEATTPPEINISPSANQSQEKGLGLYDEKQGDVETKSQITADTASTAPRPNESQTSLLDSASLLTTPAATTSSNSNDRPRTPGSRESRGKGIRRDSSPRAIGMDAAVGAGKSVGKIVTTGVKSPMNFCLGLAKGFRNIPHLYNDETVRPVEKVTDIPTGIKVAGKEFGYGLFDGIAGLVTQPLKGAEKDGVGGLVKGVGKGIGGLVAKPAAGFWGIPAYTMQGVHAQVSKLFARSSQNHIVTARIIQSQRELRSATIEERNDIMLRWQAGEFDLKRFHNWQKSDRSQQKSPAPGTSPYIQNSGSPRGNWINSINSFVPGLDEKLSKLPVDLSKIMKSSSSGSGPSHTGSAVSQISTDAEFERAIQASVQETSRGDAKEDAMIEAAVRQSVIAVRQNGELPDPVIKMADKNYSIFEDKEYKVTDEEYQALIEKAIQQSLGAASEDVPQSQEEAGSSRQKQAAIQEQPLLDTKVSAPAEQTVTQEPYDADLQRAIEASRHPPALPPRESPTEEDEFERAIAASKEEMEREKSQRTEEDVVLEYIKKQSLAEEEYRRQMSKGKERAPGDGQEDEDLRKAMEESLRMSGHGDSGPSGASGA